VVGLPSEALADVARERPDLVLLDLMTPSMTGWKVLAWLHHAHAGLPVVCMTAAYGVKAESERCHASGHLAKPFNIDELLRAVAHFVTTPT
jgi:CheY-like chemotaxis protein